MANLSINYFAIKAQPEAMKKFIMCAARKRGVTCDAATAAHALDLLLSSERKFKKGDWRKEDKVYMSDFAKGDLESELSYLRLADTADGRSLVLLFESSTRWESPLDWIYTLSDRFDIEINWYSIEEFSEWKMINGKYFTCGLVAPDGRSSLDDSFGVAGQMAVEADMMARSVIGGYICQGICA